MNKTLICGWPVRPLVSYLWLIPVETHIFHHLLLIFQFFLRLFWKFYFLVKYLAGELIGESTFMKVLNGLNETINVVLEYLKDAKVIISIPLTIICFSYTYFCDVQEHGQNKGNDLLASVRVVGRYALCILSHPCLYRAQSRLCQLTNFF